jgi:hypothetical protein
LKFAVGGMAGTLPAGLARATRGELRSEKLRYERLLTEAWGACDAMDASGNTTMALRYEERFLLRLGEYEAICDHLAARG